MQNLIFGVIGGLGLFLFGMKYLSDSLQQVAGTKLRRLMRSLTDNKFKGIALGTIVTSIIQSSSVTTILLIGLLNAGIISLLQSVAVIYGTNIGTTVTAQIIAFKVTKYALPAIGVGFLILILSKKKKTQSWGQVILSLGLIFLGLSTMSGVLKPLKDIPAVVDFLVSVGQNPLLGIGLGALLTITIQSSSAAIGMLIILAGIGLIDFNAALYLLLGTNIGTTVTAWLGSLSSHTSAKRMALIHSLFNIGGATYFAVLIYTGIYPKFIDFITPGIITTDTLGRNIANAHTFFNIFNAIVFLPFTGLMVKISKKLIPGEDLYIPTETKYLQDSLLNSPEIALQSAHKEIKYMAELSQKSFLNAMDGFINNDKKSIHKVATMEDAVDSLQSDITFYLAKLSTKQLSSELSSRIPHLLHSVNDIERISDHAVNITNITERKISEQAKLSDYGSNEILSIFTDIKEMFKSTIDAIGAETNKSAKNALFYENQINKNYKKFIDNHLKRFSEKKCSAINSFIYIDIINNLEKIGDHLTNIAQASLGELATVEQVNY
jgi:phosphate:Na+ symporter